MLKYILLGLLDYRPMSGYDLENWISVSAGNFWHAKLSQIYTTLKSLEAEGHVVSHIEPQEGRPDRRVYQITETGQGDLRAWLREPITDLATKKDSLLVKLFFQSPQEKQMLLTQLRLHVTLHQHKLAEYRQQTPQAIQDMLNDQPQLMANALLWDSARRFGEMYEMMYIAWLDETIARIEGAL
jgi:PadR family transcriptional regulator, regulatory protein AphA